MLKSFLILNITAEHLECHTGRTWAPELRKPLFFQSEVSRLKFWKGSSTLLKTLVECLPSLSCGFGIIGDCCAVLEIKYHT